MKIDQQRCIRGQLINGHSFDNSLILTVAVMCEKNVDINYTFIVKNVSLEFSRPPSTLLVKLELSVIFKIKKSINNPN